ncbi:hypothetical protein MKK88_05750 [Methylobacterium sp. E-005]|uniref:phage tail fiber protein n=1 Tax=Methylobacterium sp. E-005 TaxID=2836549 RepID=UPI001FBA381E|nr:hypothetical protein [Methylobacterium sp. E-005]MCJ2085498.1 hypothetical protein [Methylobacterium sp. E-005]
MSGNSTYLAQAVLNWARGTAMPTAPSALYVALFNGDPTDAGTGGTEVTTSVRTAGRVAAPYGAPSGKGMTNTSAVSFGNSANTVANVTHFAVFDAASGGNMLGSNPLASGGGAITAGSTVSFAAGALTWAE